MIKRLSTYFRLIRPMTFACMLACYGTGSSTQQGYAQSTQADSDRPALTEGLLDTLFGDPRNSSTTKSTETPIEKESSGSIKGKKETSPLALIQTGMLTVSQNLAKGNVGSETRRMQNEIVYRLDELILSLRPSDQTSSSSNSSSARPINGQTNSNGLSIRPNSLPGEGQDEGNSSPNKNSLPNDLAQGNGEGDQGGQIRESSVREGQVGPASSINLNQGIWGHLPERVRQQMQATQSSRFLPQYQKLIEEYYRRLSEK